MGQQIHGHKHLDAHLYTVLRTAPSAPGSKSDTLRQKPGVGETEGPQWTCAGHYNTQNTLQISNPKKVTWIQGQIFSHTYLNGEWR